MSVKTRYFTFGQDHIHRIDGVTYDKDCVVEIKAENPREVMLEVFGREWAFEYASTDEVGMQYYPRGVFTL